MDNPAFTRTVEFGRYCKSCESAGRTTGVGHGKVSMEMTPEGIEVCPVCDEAGEQR